MRTPPSLIRAYDPTEKNLLHYRQLVQAIGIDRGPFRAWEYPAALEALAPIEPSAKVLSIGSFNCGLSMWLSRVLDPARGGGVCCCDFFGPMTSSSMAWGPAAKIVEVGRGEPLPLSDQSVDYAIAISSLEHSEHDAVTAREVGRVLRPGGRFALTCEWTLGEGCWEPDIVGGWIYSTQMLRERLVEPSGLMPLGDLESLALPENYGQVLNDEPRYRQLPVRLCPVLVTLGRSG